MRARGFSPTDWNWPSRASLSLSSPESFCSPRCSWEKKKGYRCGSPLDESHDNETKCDASALAATLAVFLVLSLSLFLSQMEHLRHRERTLRGAVLLRDAELRWCLLFSRGFGAFLGRIIWESFNSGFRVPVRFRIFRYRDCRKWYFHLLMYKKKKNFICEWKILSRVENKRKLYVSNALALNHRSCYYTATIWYDKTRFCASSAWIKLSI